MQIIIRMEEDKGMEKSKVISETTSTAARLSVRL
jgi:hypothetical protein